MSSDMMTGPRSLAARERNITLSEASLAMFYVSFFSSDDFKMEAEAEAGASGNEKGRPFCQACK